ncbi:MAG: twin-arginine translocase TatA/TatE family subunit [Anaerolineae bacterium]
MNFLGIGTGELLLILLIVLLVMGPERLPQLIRQWAKVVKTLSQFTRTWQQFNAELNRQLTLDDLAGRQPPPAARPAPAPLPPTADSETDNNLIAPPELVSQAALDAPSRPAPPDEQQSSQSNARPSQQPADLSPVVEDPPHEQ